MNSLPASPLDSLLEKINSRKAELNALRPLTPEQEGRIMQKFRLDWNYHSNAIEGNSLTFGETTAFLMEGLTAKGKPFKDHLDIKGHNEAIDYLLSFVQNESILTEKNIRELHELILVEPYTIWAKTEAGQNVEKRVTLGAYKSMPNHVKTPTGEIHFYATPEETPAKMADLTAWLHKHQAQNDLHPLVLAATFHHRFVSIHPFDDGNGRLARLLMNLLLMQKGFPPIVIKQEDRKAYYYALRQADAGDLSVFIEYLGENLLHSLQIQLRGARGESLEEVDDLDKEIALLKQGLGSYQATAKSEVFITEFMTKTVFPLLAEIQDHAKKLNDLFARAESAGQLSTSTSTGETNIINPDWRILSLQSLFQGPPIQIQKLEYRYHWIEFQRTKSPFSIECSIQITFDQYTYQIRFFGQEYERTITKNYPETLTQAEFSELSKLFAQEAVAQIKTRNGQS